VAEKGDTVVKLRAWSLRRHMPGGDEPVIGPLDLAVRRGEWIALLGANGSGKTSLLRYLAGPDAPVAGRARLITQDPDDQLIAATARDELGLAGCDADQARGLLLEFGLADQTDLDPLLLSAGQKQRLQLASALADNPDLLLADEPTALQDRDQSAWVLGQLETWRARTGAAVLMACQSDEELAAADRAILLAEGGIELDGPSVEVARHEAVRALLESAPPRAASIPLVPSGAEPEVPAPTPGGGGQATVVARWSDVGCRFGDRAGFAGVELELVAGARYGLIGPNGCGKSTLLAVAAGLRRPDAGRVELVGRQLYAGSARDLDHGAAMLAPQFPEYLFTRRRIVEEVALDPALAEAEVGDLVAAAGLPGGLEERDPHLLSTGQRRRLALALVTRSRRPLLLLDEPTAALDAEGRRRVEAMIAAVPPACAVVIASHDHRFLERCGAQILELEPWGLRKI